MRQSIDIGGFEFGELSEGENRVHDIVSLRSEFEQHLFAGLVLAGLVAAAVSIVTKELLYWYTLAVAKRVNSPAVKANAWHHRSDAFSSIGT